MSSNTYPSTANGSPVEEILEYYLNQVPDTDFIQYYQNTYNRDIKESVREFTTNIEFTKERDLAVKYPQMFLNYLQATKTLDSEQINEVTWLTYLGVPQTETSQALVVKKLTKILSILQLMG